MNKLDVLSKNYTDGNMFATVKEKIGADTARVVSRYQ